MSRALLAAALLALSACDRQPLLEQTAAADEPSDLRVVDVHRTTWVLHDDRRHVTCWALGIKAWLELDPETRAMWRGEAETARRALRGGKGR